jgi:hypothetical protein
METKQLQQQWRRSTHQFTPTLLLVSLVFFFFFAMHEQHFNLSKVLFEGSETTFTFSAIECQQTYATDQAAMLRLRSSLSFISSWNSSNDPCGSECFN